MEIEQLNQAHAAGLLELWNRVFDANFRLDGRTLQRKVFACTDICYEASFVAIENGKVAGFVIARRNEMPLADYKDCAFLSAIAVAPELRGRGIGSRLLGSSEKVLLNLGARKWIVGCEVVNFFSGIPSPTEELTGIFEHWGFVINREPHFDLTADVSKLDLRSMPVKVNESGDYEVRPMRTGDLPAFEAFMEQTFAGRWKYEMNRFLNAGGDPGEIVLLLRGERVFGFSKIHASKGACDADPVLGEHWGALGPIGISQEVRGEKLGSRLLRDALCILQDRGARNVIIDWTELVHYYGNFGFKPFRTFLYANKEL